MKNSKVLPIEEPENDEDEVLEEEEDEEDEDNEEEDTIDEEDEGGILFVGLSSGEKFMADLIETLPEVGVFVFYRPLRVIEFIDNDSSQIRFNTFSPFIYEQILNVQAEHVVFACPVTDEAEEIYSSFCAEMEREERKLARQAKKKSKEETRSVKDNVITASFRKPLRTE